MLVEAIRLSFEYISSNHHIPEAFTDITNLAQDIDRSSHLRSFVFAQIIIIIMIYSYSYQP